MRELHQTNREEYNDLITFGELRKSRAHVVKRKLIIARREASGQKIDLKFVFVTD